MATTIGAVNVLLSLKSSAFSKGMRSATVQVQTFQTSMKAAAASAAAMGAGIAAAAGGAALAGLVALTKQAMRVGDEMAKLSDSVGISAENMAGLRLGAQLAGTEIESLTTGVVHLQRAIADGDPVLQQIGLDPQELLRMSAFEQLGATADALRKVGNQAKRTDFIQTLFGRGGREMSALLQQGSEGFRNLTVEAGKYGLALSRLDLGKIEAANDSFTRVKAALSGIGHQIAVELAAPIEGVGRLFTEMATQGYTAGAIVRTGIHFVVAEVAALADMLRDLLHVLEQVKATAVGAFGVVQQKVGGLVADLGALIGGDFGTNLQMAGGFMGAQGGANVNSALDLLNRRSPDAEAPSDVILDFWSDLEANIKAAGLAAKHAAENMNRLDMAVPTFLKRPDEDNFIGPPDLLANVKTSARELDAVIGQMSNFSIGFRQIDASAVRAIRPGTVFGEQTGTLVNISKQQLEVLKRIDAGIGNIGSLN